MTGVPPPNQPNQPNTNQSINNLINSINSLISTINSDSKNRKGNNRKSQDQNKSLTHSLNNVAVQMASLASVNLSLASQFKSVEDLQKKAIAQNTNVSNIYSKNSDILSKTQGSNFELQAQIMKLNEEGLKDVGGSVLALSSRMKMTGQSTDTLAKFVTQSRLQMAMTGETTEELADRIASLSAKYGVSTERLIKSLDKVAETTAKANLLGLGGGNFSKQMQAMMSQFKGSAAEEALSQFFNMTMDPRSLKLQQLAGAEADIAALQKGGLGQQEFERVATSAMTKIENYIKSSTASIGANQPGGVNISRYMDSRLQAYFGDVSTQQLTAFSQMTKVLEETRQDAKRGTQDVNTFENAIKSGMKPVENIMQSGYTSIITSLGDLITKVTPVLAILAMSKGLGGATSLLGGGGGGTGGLLGGLGRILGTVARFIPHLAIIGTAVWGVTKAIDYFSDSSKEEEETTREKITEAIKSEQECKDKNTTTSNATLLEGINNSIRSTMIQSLKADEAVRLQKQTVEALRSIDGKTNVDPKLPRRESNYLNTNGGK